MSPMQFCKNTTGTVTSVQRKRPQGGGVCFHPCRPRSAGQRRPEQVPSARDFQPGRQGHSSQTYPTLIGGGMARLYRGLTLTAFLFLSTAGVLRAQEPATVTGTVRNEQGVGISTAQVVIESLNIGATARDAGRFTLSVPAFRVTGQ